MVSIPILAWWVASEGSPVVLLIPHLQMFSTPPPISVSPSLMRMRTMLGRGLWDGLCVTEGASPG